MLVASRSHSHLSAPHPGEQDAAFAALYSEFCGAVRAAALRIVRVECDADDVCQQVFAQAWAQRDRYDAARGDLKAWLLGIARSRAIDYLRTARRRSALPFDESSDAHSWSCPADAVEQRENVERVSRAVMMLTPHAKRVLELAYAEGLTHRQIAAVTGRPIGTVKTVLRSAIRAVRGSLSGPGASRMSAAALVRPSCASEAPFTTALVDVADDAFTACRRPVPRLPLLRGLHVLAVDDDSPTRELLDGIFRKTGAHVTLCRDAADGLAALAAVWPDVLIADINMPGIDGYGLMGRVRALAQRDDRSLPALAFTACGTEAERSRARLAGFDLHLSKPLHPAALVQAVHRLSGQTC